MTVSPATLAAFRADIADIPCHDDPKYVGLKSRDYFWYSPILSAELDGLSAQLVVQPRSEAEVISIAAAVARHRLPLTIRGGGTGNYGQCVPMQGGVILETTKLDRVINIAPGRVVCEAGARMETVEKAVAATGQMLSMFPSTKRLATMAGFVSGGSGGIGSLRNGMLRDGSNITYVRIVTVEPTPQIIELHGADILKVQHAYGTNGIITAMDYALVPKTDWLHTTALFDGYDAALRFAAAAQDEGLDCFLMTVVEGRLRDFTNAWPIISRATRMPCFPWSPPTLCKPLPPLSPATTVRSPYKRPCMIWKPPICPRMGMWLEPHHLAGAEGRTRCVDLSAGRISPAL